MTHAVGYFIFKKVFYLFALLQVLNRFQFLRQSFLPARHAKQVADNQQPNDGVGRKKKI